MKKDISINSRLRTFAEQNLILARTSQERDKITNSLNHLEVLIKNNSPHPIYETYPFGSWERNTILPRKFDPNSDVDLLIVYNTSQKTMTAETYRNGLRDLILRTYPKSYIKKDFPSIRLELNHILFDLVPCKIEKSLFLGDEYKVPDKVKEWITTEPWSLKKDLAEANKRYPTNMLRNIIRLCKCWNSSNLGVFQSYSMEKAIVKMNFNGYDVYTGFIHALTQLSPNDGTNQAVNYIKKYNEELNQSKELFWLSKLLPGFI